MRLISKGPRSKKFYVQADISKYQDIDKFYKLLKKFKRIDVLINNAGYVALMKSIMLIIKDILMLIWTVR